MAIKRPDTPLAETVFPGEGPKKKKATKDSTNYLTQKRDAIVSKWNDSGYETGGDKGYKKAQSDYAKAQSDIDRQSKKGEQGFNKNGYPVKNKK